VFQDEDEMFIAECPPIPGCMSQGKTEQEAEKNIQEAIKECLNVRAEKGMPLTVAIRQVEFMYNACCTTLNAAEGCEEF